MKPIIDLPAEHYLELIRDNKPFQLSRFGDGEIICMNLSHNNLRHNCDNSRFLPELEKPMKQIFKNKYNYYHCLLDCSFNVNGKYFKEFIENTCPDMDFYNGEIWQHLSMDGRITELIEAIAPYHPVFVGGKHISNVHHMKGMVDMAFFEIPERDSFLEFDYIIDSIKWLHSLGRRMFLFSAGFTTKPLIDTLFPFIGHDTFMLDMGSALDPYCGRLSRDGMKFYGFDKFQPYTNMELK